MATLKIHAQKLNLIEWLLKLKDKSVLKQIENIKAGSDFWDDLTSYEKEEINQGINELEKGKKHLYEDIIRKHRVRK